MQLELLNDQGQATSKYEAPETVFGRAYNEDLVHKSWLLSRRMPVKAHAPRKIVNRSSTRPRSHSSKREPVALALV